MSGIAPDSVLAKTNAGDDYYMFPIRPNEVNTLAGNMGELRTTHFHAGLDIRTGGRTGLPVYAAADGYVSRAAVKAGGYGKALYLTHYNGETTVYAHLEKFNGSIGKHVKTHQYSTRSLFFNKYFKKDVFKVKKGDIIAYSGNSGSSAGPHLHFEIRDKDQQILNPLKYHFEEIRDTTPPIFKRLALTPKNIDARINNRFDRVTFPIIKEQSKYAIKDTIQVYGNVGFELLAYDMLNDAHYKCGISKITFEMDDVLVFSQQIDTISFSAQRNILTHYNYPAYKSSGQKYHKLYLADGNQLPFYTTNTSNGLLDLKKKGVKQGVVKIIDVFGNESELIFHVKVAPYNAQDEIEEVSNKPEIKLLENTLIIKEPLTSSVKLIAGNKTVTPSYHSDEMNYYLIDLRNGIPKISVNDSTMSTFDHPSVVVPNKSYAYYSPHIEVQFTKYDLFDTIYFSTSYRHQEASKSNIFTIGDPAHSSLKQRIDITLLVDQNWDISSNNSTHVYKKNGNSHSFIGGTWNGNKISFRTRELGNFTLLTDDEPPAISPIRIGKESISFKIKDNLSGINKFDVYVNNQWVLMDYDYKTAQIWSDALENVPFTGEVRLRVTDNAGNEQTFLTKIPL
jgi:hypothetical protein